MPYILEIDCAGDAPDLALSTFRPYQISKFEILTDGPAGGNFMFTITFDTVASARRWVLEYFCEGDQEFFDEIASTHPELVEA